MTLRPSVCIDAVLENIPLNVTLQCLADCGYQAFEFWRWWDRDIEELLIECERRKMQVAACCTKFVSLVDPQSREAYLDGLTESIAAAQRLDCRILISQVGDFRPGVPRLEQHECMVQGLREAAAILAGSKVTLAIEPLNELVDHPGYYLIRSDEAFRIIDEVSSPHVKVTFDVYHQQISEGNLIQNVITNIDKIAHFHAAGNPGRHELTHGEIHYPAVFDAIQSTNYEGYVGLEYWPLDKPSVGLRQVADWF